MNLHVPDAQLAIAFVIQDDGVRSGRRGSESKHSTTFLNDRDKRWVVCFFRQKKTAIVIMMRVECPSGRWKSISRVGRVAITSARFASSVSAATASPRCVLASLLQLADLQSDLYTNNEPFPFCSYFSIPPSPPSVSLLSSGCETLGNLIDWQGQCFPFKCILQRRL